MKQLAREDLEKLKHWVNKVNNRKTCKTCGDKCILQPKEEKMKKIIVSMKDCQNCKSLKAQNPDIESVEIEDMDMLLKFARAVGIKSMPFVVVTGDVGELNDDLAKKVLDFTK